MPAGTDAVKVVYAGDTHYQTASSNVVSVVVTTPVLTLTLTSTPNPQVLGQPVAFTVNLGGGVTGQTYSGSVSFSSGTTLLGSATVNSAGAATLTLDSLTIGVQKVTAVFTSTDKQTTVTSNTISQSIIDFSIGSTTPTLTVNYGNVADFSIDLAPVKEITSFNQPVTLTVTGLLASYTSSFASVTVNPASAGASTHMLIQTVVSNLVAAADHKQHETAFASMALGFLLMPVLGIRRIRRKLPKVIVMIVVGLVAFGFTAPVMGCGGGYFGTTPNSYTLTVTGTSGKLQHSTTVTLNVH